MSTKFSSGTDTHIAQLVDRFFRRMQVGLDRRAKEFDTDRIGPGGSMILLTLEEIEPAPIHQLVTRMARDKSQMTRAVRALEAKNLIERMEASEDARVVLIQLTDKGQETVRRIQRALAETLDELLVHLSSADRQTFGWLLEQATREAPVISQNSMTTQEA
ncbi:MAG: MarR family transcriptional regulator [Dinoroseobacter sp.]|nr:MarR family transcriptional regulator [Dinoroseobacter sp.]